MGIYIRGMKMPKDIEPGLVIEFANGIDGKRYARLYHYQHGGLTEWLEAVSIPPHGRLIDGDVLEEKAIERSEKRGEMINVLDNVITAYDISTAPTIIEAEEE